MATLLVASTVKIAKTLASVDTDHGKRGLRADFPPGVDNLCTFIWMPESVTASLYFCALNTDQVPNNRLFLICFPGKCVCRGGLLTVPATLEQ